MALSVLKRLVGFDLLADLSEFFTAFSGMIDGFQDRAHRVSALLADEETCFVIVCGPQSDQVDEAVFFHSKLMESDMNFGGAVVNRVRYRLGTRVPKVKALTGKLEPELEREGLAKDVARTLIEYDQLALRDEKNISRLRESLTEDEPVIRVPYLDTDVHDIEGLTVINEYLFADEETRVKLATG